MKLRSALNNGFLFLGIGSIFIGMLRGGDNVDFVGILPLVIFFIFFRIKMWLDDAVYFSREKRKNALFDLGVIFAIVAWCLWAVAGYTITTPATSYLILMWALLVLVAWILADALHNKCFAENRKYFILLNLIYTAVLWVMSTDTVILPFPKTALGWLLVAGTLIDFLFHGSLKNFEEEFDERKQY